MNTLRTNTSSQAKRGTISCVSVCVICQLSGVTARETLLAPRQRKFLFGATNKFSDEDARKNMYARHMHSRINFHHFAACCLKISVSFYLQFISFTKKKKNIYIPCCFNLSDQNHARGKRETKKLFSFPLYFWNERELFCSRCSRMND